MYLEKLRLANVACFDELTLDFTREGKPCPWVVLLGENGSGKSTLLQTIALALLGDELIHEIAGGVDWGNLARTRERPGRVELDIVSQRADVVGTPSWIFLSYAPDDRPQVRELYEKLTQAGLRPWMDIEDILPGAKWSDALNQALRESALILVALSQASETSHSQRTEIEKALALQAELDSNIYLIPFRLEPCRVPDFLRDRHWVDLFEERGFERLLRAIRQVLMRRAKRSHPTRAGRERQLRLRAGFDLSPAFRTGLRSAEDTVQDLLTLNSTLYNPPLQGGWFACAYGSWRRLSRADMSQPREALANSGRKSHRFATMFDAESALTRVHDWLIDLDYRRLKDPEDRQTAEAFNLAVLAIERMLPGVRFQGITTTSEVVFEESGAQIPIHRLSDGYRSTLAWVGDLVRRLVEAFPEDEEPLSAPGVVLIDEIDLHLHPKWQRSIVEEVRQLFPNLQFIVSSHSPFVAQDALESDKIIVLRKGEGKVEAEEELEDVRGWRVDQILTSSLFGLENTRGQQIAAKETEFQGLLDLQAQGKLGGDDEKRLDELKSWLGQHKSAPGETVEENEIFDAARSLIDLVDQQLARRS